MIAGRWGKPSEVLLDLVVDDDGGDSLDSIVCREAVAADIPALAELHVTTWNATYNSARGPTVATRAWQWNQEFAKDGRRDFVLVLVDRNARLIGFTWQSDARLLRSHGRRTCP
ncbi:MAG: hypothetical protein ABI625_17060 [bacterium]